jgi:hypothetical protein
MGSVLFHSWGQMRLAGENPQVQAEESALTTKAVCLAGDNGQSAQLLSSQTQFLKYRRAGCKRVQLSKMNPNQDVMQNIAIILGHLFIFYYTLPPLSTSRK